MSYPTAYTAKVMVPLPNDDAVRAVMGSDYDPASTLNVIKMMAGTEDIYPALVGMVRAIFATKGIDDKHREMIIIRAAKVLDCPYEWQANAKMAANAGLTAEEIAATQSDGPVTGIDAEYLLLCTAVDELSRGTTLSDGTLSRLLDTYGEVLTRKYVATIAWFNLLRVFAKINWTLGG